MANDTIRDWLSVVKMAVYQCSTANLKTRYHDALFSRVRIINIIYLPTSTEKFRNLEVEPAINVRESQLKKKQYA